MLGVFERNLSSKVDGRDIQFKVENDIGLHNCIENTVTFLHCILACGTS